MGEEKFIAFFSNAWTVFMFIMETCAKIGGFGVFVMLLSVVLTQKKQIDKVWDDMEAEDKRLEKKRRLPPCFVCGERIKFEPVMASEVPPLSDGEAPEVICQDCFSKHFAPKKKRV